MEEQAHQRPITLAAEMPCHLLIHSLSEDLIQQGGGFGMDAGVFDQRLGDIQQSQAMARNARRVIWSGSIQLGWHP